MSLVSSFRAAPFKTSVVALFAVFSSACSTPHGYYRSLYDREVATSAPQDCPSILRLAFERGTEFQGQLGATAATTDRRLLRYPLHVNPLENPNWHLMYGFESEYAPDEWAKLFEIYGPRPELMPSTQWFSLRPEEKLSWARTYLASLGPDPRESGFIKLLQDENRPYLPEKLVFDQTGNLEIVLKPVNTLEEWSEQAKWINTRFGTGSMQGTVSVPRQPFFGLMPFLSIQERSAIQRSNVGYLNFIHDFDVLEKLVAGASRYSADRSKQVARSFAHPWLGPISEAKQARMLEYLEANARGDRFDVQSVRWVREHDASFKYIGSTAYRPDIASPERIATEVRDANKNFDLLTDRMLRKTFYLQNGREQFEPFSEIRAFNAASDFDKLSPEAQRMLKRLFPARFETGQTYLPDDQLALEVYRNFAYPMRDWNAHVRALGNPEGLNASVARARDAYSRELNEIARALESSQMTDVQASTRVQGALAGFSVDSRIGESYLNWQRSHVAADPRWNRYMELTLQEVAPFREAFPESVWEGPLSTRLARFASKWRSRVRIVEDVNFELRQNGIHKSKSRKVLAISTSGMRAPEIRELTTDYLNAVSRGTVSFPSGPSPEHLYTRLGHVTADFFNAIDLKAYRSPSRERLEALVALDPSEEMSLRTYFENASNTPRAVLGRFQMGGVPDARTVGRLTDNRPLDPTLGHNCTSWLCTAPIGVQSQPLYDLAGAQAFNQFHTNPGWWNAFLVSGAKSERVPAVVYWSSEPLPAIEAKLQRARTTPFQWDFNLH